MNNKTQPTPEQLEKWRKRFESRYDPARLFFQCGEYSDRYVQYAWQGYLRAKQESEQVLKDARKQAIEEFALLIDSSDYYAVENIDQYHIDADAVRGLINDN